MRTAGGSFPGRDAWDDVVSPCLDRVQVVGVAHQPVVEPHEHPLHGESRQQGFEARGHGRDGADEGQGVTEEIGFLARVRVEQPVGETERREPWPMAWSAGGVTESELET